MTNNGKSIDLEALLGRVQGMPIYNTKREERVQGLPIYSTPVKINQEPGLNDIVRNLKQKITTIMTTELDKLMEGVHKILISSTPVEINQEPGLDNIVRNLEQLYSTPVNINQEPTSCRHDT